MRHTMNNKKAPSQRKTSARTRQAAEPLHFAVVGAGMAGVACARTLLQAGHRVTLLEKSRGFGGRMATRRTEFGGFDHGAQYFTVRDARFEQVLRLTATTVVRPWSASTVRVLDEFGHVLASAPPPDWTPAARCMWSSATSSMGSTTSSTWIGGVEPGRCRAWSATRPQNGCS